MQVGDLKAVSCFVRIGFDEGDVEEVKVSYLSASSHLSRAAFIHKEATSRLAQANSDRNS